MDKPQAMIRLEAITKEVYPIAKEFNALVESFSNTNPPTQEDVNRVNDLADEIEQLVMKAQALMDCVQITNVSKNPKDNTE